MGLFKEGSFNWIATRMDDIRKLAISIIFIVGTGYAGLDYIGSKFVTQLEASNYALKSNVARMDLDLTRMQITVLQKELFYARKVGIVPEDKVYYRTVDKRLFLLKIKMRILDAVESDYIVPTWLQE